MLGCRLPGGGGTSFWGVGFVHPPPPPPPGRLLAMSSLTINHSLNGWGGWGVNPQAPLCHKIAFLVLPVPRTLTPICSHISSVRACLYAARWRRASTIIGWPRRLSQGRFPPYCACACWSMFCALCVSRAAASPSGVPAALRGRPDPSLFLSHCGSPGDMPTSTALYVAKLSWGCPTRWLSCIWESGPDGASCVWPPLGAFPSPS